VMTRYESCLLIVLALMLHMPRTPASLMLVRADGFTAQISENHVNGLARFFMDSKTCVKLTRTALKSACHCCDVGGAQSTCQQHGQNRQTLRQLCSSDHHQGLKTPSARVPA
jgi:hypothetical protein